MKRDLIVAVLLTFCFLVTLFGIIPTSCQGPGDYDPWYDVNDDGTIDMRDIGGMARKFGANGIPVNKTALLYNISDTFAELISRIDALNASSADLEELLATIADLNNTVVELQSTVASLNMMMGILETELEYMNATLTQKISDLETLITEMNANITLLETNLAILNATKLGAPDYDSFEDPAVGGWEYLKEDEAEEFHHGLNTTNVLVYIVFSNSSTGNNINHEWYGGQNSGTFWGGAWWYDLTDFDIKVKRYAHSNNCAYVRVVIWRIPEL